MCYCDRAYYCVSSLTIWARDSRWNFYRVSSVAFTNVNRMMLFSLSAGKKKYFIRGTNSDNCGWTIMDEYGKCIL